MRRPNPPGLAKSSCALTPDALVAAIRIAYPRSYITRDHNIKVLRGDVETPPAKPDEAARIVKVNMQTARNREHDDAELDTQIEIRNMAGYFVYVIKATMRVETANRKLNLVERYESVLPDPAFVTWCTGECETRLTTMRKKLAQMQRDSHH